MKRRKSGLRGASVSHKKKSIEEDESDVPIKDNRVKVNPKA